MSEQRFLVAYDYGQGAVWAFVVAPSADAVTAVFPELTVVDEPPDWLNDVEAQRLAVLHLEEPTGLLADLLRSRIGAGLLTGCAADEEPAIYDAMSNDLPEATDAGERPFGSRRDAGVYLFQVVSVVSSVAGGSALFISGRVPLGLGVFGVGAVLFLLVLRPRSRRLEPPSEWPVREWNESQREMDTLRLRHMRAALRMRGLPEPLSYILVGAAALVVATAVVVNWNAYF